MGTAAEDKKHPFLHRQIRSSLLKAFLSWRTPLCQAAFSHFFVLVRPLVLVSKEQNLLLSLHSLPAELKEIQQLAGFFCHPFCNIAPFQQGFGHFGSAHVTLSLVTEERLSRQGLQSQESQRAWGCWQSPRQLLLVPVFPGSSHAALSMACHPPVHVCCGSSGVALEGGRSTVQGDVIQVPRPLSFPFP